MCGIGACTTDVGTRGCPFSISLSFKEIFRVLLAQCNFEFWLGICMGMRDEMEGADAYIVVVYFREECPPRPLLRSVCRHYGHPFWDRDDRI